ncbi:MAG: indolepyruvate oxidoreductase subunit beta [Clostridia bacterium]
MRYDILIAGVGGQGTILSSRLLAEAAQIENRFVRTGETIGMSQRGGSVVSHVRIDSRDVSPYIPLGSADLLIAFELAEAARSLNRLKPGGRLLVSTQRLDPVTVTLGGMTYDEPAIRAALSGALFIDGYALAEQAGSAKAVNVVLLGAALGAGMLPLSKSSVLTAIDHMVKEKFRELNYKALELGFNYAEQA